MSTEPRTVERIIQLAESVNATAIANSPTVGEHIAGICRDAARELRRLSGVAPDYVFDPSAGTMPEPYLWDDRDGLVMEGGEADPIKIGTLIRGPDLWAVVVPIGDAEGTVEGHEVEFFTDKDRADAYVREMSSTEPDVDPLLGF